MILLSKVVRALLLAMVSIIVFVNFYIFMHGDIVFGLSSILAFFVLFKIYFRRTAMVSCGSIVFIGVFHDLRVSVCDIENVSIYDQLIWKNSYVMKFKLKNSFFKIYSGDLNNEVKPAIEAAAFRTETNNFGTIYHMS